MYINKFQRSLLTFYPRLLILESHQYIKTVFSESSWPIELKFHMKTSYDRLAKIYTNCSGDMTKIAVMPIEGINFLSIFSGTKKPLALLLGM